MPLWPIRRIRRSISFPAKMRQENVDDHGPIGSRKASEMRFAVLGRPCRRTACHLAGIRRVLSVTTAIRLQWKVDFPFEEDDGRSVSWRISTYRYQLVASLPTSRVASRPSSQLICWIIGYCFPLEARQPLGLHSQEWAGDRDAYALSLLRHERLRGYRARAAGGRGDWLSCTNRTAGIRATGTSRGPRAVQEVRRTDGSDFFLICLPEARRAPVLILGKMFSGISA
jgi:hypothetical protein